MVAYIILFIAFVFVAACALLPLRLLPLPVIAAIAVYIFTPDGYLNRTIAPPPPVKQGDSMIVIAGPSFMHGLIYVLVYLAAGIIVIRLLAYTGKRLSAANIKKGLRITASVPLAVITFMIAIIMANVASSVYSTALTNAGNIHPLPVWVSYLVYFSLTAYAFYLAIKKIRHKPRNISAITFTATSALIMLAYSILTITPHVNTILRAEAFAAGNPYCIIDSKANTPPKPLAFAKMPNIGEYFGCRWPAGHYSMGAVFVQKNTGEALELELPYGGKTASNEHAVMLTCTPERFFSLKPWPRPKAETITIHTPNAVFKLPAAKATTAIQSFYPLSGGSLNILQTQHESRLFYVSAPLVNANDKNHPPLHKPEINCPGELSIGRGSDCLLRFVEKPFQYLIPISKDERAQAQEIGQGIIDYVQTWRVPSSAEENSPAVVAPE